MLTESEENYLKAIYQLSGADARHVSTNAISELMNTKPASVSDMLKKLDGKGLLSYRKYHGVSLSGKGRSMALQLIRRHRLWEVFLVEKLRFTWDEVHEVAEQLEHIQSPLLIQRLDEYLGFPPADPHGEPIPDENGNLNTVVKLQLDQAKAGAKGKVVAVNNEDPNFLKYLDKVGICLGARLEVLDKIEFDGSVELLLDSGRKVFISREVSKNILITD